MAELTDRQIRILKAIIDEYINTAEPVGSEKLDKKFGLGVSPATIRNEMVTLTKTGFLKQPYTSAGRVPTSMALKFYVHNLMKAKELSVADEVLVKQKIWDYRQELNRLLQEATKVLAQRTHSLALSATNTGDMYYSGTANILEMPEFFDIDMTRNLLYALDETDFWWNLVSVLPDNQPFHILIGEELGRHVLDNCGSVFTKFNIHGTTVVMGVIGPSRINFPSVVPMVTYFGTLLSGI